MNFNSYIIGNRLYPREILVGASSINQRVWLTPALPQGTSGSLLMPSPLSFPTFQFICRLPRLGLSPGPAPHLKSQTLNFPSQSTAWDPCSFPITLLPQLPLPLHPDLLSHHSFLFRSFLASFSSPSSLDSILLPI